MAHLLLDMGVHPDSSARVKVSAGSECIYHALALGLLGSGLGITSWLTYQVSQHSKLKLSVFCHDQRVPRFTRESIANFVSVLPL